ncbi:MAG: permease-like cell division protein FtsX [Patescibacteria group bacterium]
MIAQHLRTAFVHIRRSPYQALAAVLVMTLTFFVATIFAFTAYIMTVTLHYFETRPQIIAFLKNDATPEAVSALSQKLANDSRVRSDIRYVSHEEALQIYRETADNPLVTELVSPDVLPASLEFSVTNLSYTQEVIAEVKQVPIVDRVEFTASLGGETSLATVIGNLQRITRYVRIGGAALLSFLSVTALLTLLVVIGTRVASRREEIQVLTLIGATPGFIRAPFLFEGITYAVTGALAGFISATLLFLYLMPNLAKYFGEILSILREIPTLLTQLGMLAAIELTAALLIGIVGAWFAIARYLKMR